MANEQLGRFEERFFSLAQNLESSSDGERIMKIDAEVPPEYLTPDLGRVVELFEPYGEANPPLRFLTRGLAIAGVEYFGKKGPVHLKLLLETGTFKWPAIIWNGADSAKAKFGLGERIDVVYRITKSPFQGREALQLIIQDFKQ
jgi:single-stranded-DNA-specific exonuclease